MKKVIIGLYLIIMISLLSACISIPVGDDVLKISSEGINFVSADEESDNNNEEIELNESNENNDSLDLENENNNESNEDEAFAQKDNELENMNENEEESEGSLENNEENEPNSASACEVQDHSDITESIEGELYIPECAILTDISKSDGTIKANLVIEESNWEDITDEYLHELGDQITKENQYISNESSDIRFTLENDARGRVKINQSNESVKLWIKYENS